MAYSWFRVESAIADHPKVMKLETALEEPLALAYLMRLFCWTHRYATSGFISHDLAPQMTRAVFRDWDPKRAARGIQTMAQLRILDEVDDGFWVHDWQDFQEALVKKSKRDAKNKRLKRRGRGAQTARAGHAPGARAARLQDVTDETRQDGRLYQGEPRISIVDPPNDTEARFIEFLGWKSAVRRERKLPVDCTPPKRTADRDWWGELDKHAWSYAWPPERVKKLYLEYLDDRTYRLNGKPAGELEPPYPITAFAADWQYFDTLEAMPKARGAR